MDSSGINGLAPLVVSFEAFLDEEFKALDSTCAARRAKELEAHKARLDAFPYDTVLVLAYPQMDFANRWCWQQFGPAHGDCAQHSSYYPACRQGSGHAHTGRWLTHWLMKTDYDYGFNQWCFENQADRDEFLAFVPHITWGEDYGE